ncbi:hypothetical protein IQ247_30925 [Plectonema cf. radiosum LEGE 06105]|uniref:Uncharacterized protein n=1 Tax=Plectonema cf. radiosum LEGE 06105 TaxID=945769 RepID=A0A8J7FQ14_9CYAN|nr:hypothetical protein [Plectonema radiosum]MBE9217016.1 hypothetical protein [Plectonema cf. radiosum LEGE 06105]
MSDKPVVTDGVIDFDLNAVESFRYTPMQQGIKTITVKRENTGYWVGYRKSRVKLHRRYIGVIENVTIHKLEEIAVDIDKEEQQLLVDSPKVTTQEKYVTNSVTSYATSEEVNQLRNEVTALRSEVKQALVKLQAR